MQCHGIGSGGLWRGRDRRLRPLDAERAGFNGPGSPLRKLGRVLLERPLNTWPGQNEAKIRPKLGLKVPLMVTSAAERARFYDRQ
jgi:hypothetical protein